MNGFLDKPLIQMLPDGKRLQLRHGPIELIILAEGTRSEVALAYEQAVTKFKDILHDLVSEIGFLRQPLRFGGAMPQGLVARQMVQAAELFAKDQFVTPMIAVAGAVADHVLTAMTEGVKLKRAFVNNGGDIALALAPGQSFEIGVCANPLNGELGSTIRIAAEDGIFGIATSGWRGRSHSLGIADAVSVLAENAAKADAAATLIANAVDLPGHIAIVREKACDLAPDSDLGEKLVTVDVGALSAFDIACALGDGEALARSMMDAGLIQAAYGCLQGRQFSASAASHVENKVWPFRELAHA